MKNILITVVFIFNFTLYSSQINGVGIGTNTPNHSLEVAGNHKISGDIYFENPGDHLGSSADSYLLVRDNSDKVIKRYVPATSEYTAINSTVYFLRNINSSGVSDFNTGISAARYYVAIGGFIVRGENDNPVVSLLQPGNLNQYVPQYSARSYVQNGLWHIKFTPNNNRVFNLKLEIRLSISAYRRDLLTTVNAPIIFNMNANITGIASAPAPVLP